MIRHLTRADYAVQPWANGRGETMEIARADDGDGMLWRMSVASVVENGPFSRFPGIDRILTVIDGPGFDIEGEGLTLNVQPFVPVAFAGDLTVRAAQVVGPSRDFNLMTRRSALQAGLALRSKGFRLDGQTNAVFALDAGEIDLGPKTMSLGKHDTVLSQGTMSVTVSMLVLAITLSPA